MIVRPEDSLPVYVRLFEEQQLRGLLNGDSINAFANLLYTDAQVRTEEHDISYGDSLQKLIWQPISSLLQEVDKIYYSPSGLLHKIAFDAIPLNNEQLLSGKYQLNRMISTGQIVDKDTVIFKLNSAVFFGGLQYEIDTTALKQMSFENKTYEHNNLPYTFRSLSDTNERGGSWGYLPGTQKEVNAIANILAKNNTTFKLYTDQYGTEEIVKAMDVQKSPSIIHFSTHGFFFPNLPAKKRELMDKTEMAFKYSDDPLLRSGLIMAGANYFWKGGEPLEGVEDGILTSYEVSSLYLPNTKLVVMSACETGLGDISGSEGVFGLQRAFKMAGVDYIIMSLWKVPDKETADFMILFYQNLIKMNSIQNAFSETQRYMKMKYMNEPYKWAGFVLIR
jgi:CHAT domain-containing protein